MAVVSSFANAGGVSQRVSSVRVLNQYVFLWLGATVPARRTGRLPRTQRVRGMVSMLRLEMATDGRQVGRDNAETMAETMAETHTCLHWCHCAEQ